MISQSLIVTHFYKLIETINSHIWIRHPTKSSTFICTRCNICGGISPYADYKTTTTPIYFLQEARPLTCNEAILKNIIE